MTERPINLTADEVRAVLDGRKTQLRRAVKPQPAFECHYEINGSESGAVHIATEAFEAKQFDRCYVPVLRSPLPNAPHVLMCPFGAPGDRLWVRESFVRYQTINHVRYPDGRSFAEVSDGSAAYQADGYGSIEDLRDHIRLMSGADLEGVEIESDRWRPSPQMPRWASRITLEVEAVRVDRADDGKWYWIVEMKTVEAT